MSRTEFACAADYFGAVRAAAIDAERIGRRLERMAAREGVRAQGYEAQGRDGRVRRLRHGGHEVRPRRGVRVISPRRRERVSPGVV